MEIDLIKHTSEWAMVNAIQGKLMLAFGLVLAVVVFFILKGENPILKGMLIPVVLATLINLGYGGFLTYSRPHHAPKTAEIANTSVANAVNQELVKARRDDWNYTMIKRVWPVIILVCAILMLFVSQEYYRGLIIGFIGFGFYGLVIDSMLHYNLKPYLNTLIKLSETV